MKVSYKSAVGMAIAALGFAPGAWAQGCVLCYTSLASSGPAAMHAFQVAMIALLIPALLLVCWCVFPGFPPCPDKDSCARQPESYLPPAAFLFDRQAPGRARLAPELASKRFDYRIRHAVNLLVGHFRIERQGQHFVSRAFGHRQLPGLAAERSIGGLKM